MSESTKYEAVRNNYVSTVHVIQEIAGTRAGNPKINIMGASSYGRFKFTVTRVFTNNIFSRSSYNKVKRYVKKLYN